MESQNNGIQDEHYWEEKMDDSKNQQMPLEPVNSKVPYNKSKISKLIHKMKNGNPATKALIVFLMAPKGLFIFSPLLLKKYLPADAMSALHPTIHLGPMLFMTGRLGLGVLAYALLNQWRARMASYQCSIGR